MTRNLLTLMAFGGAFALVVACSGTDEDKFGSSDQFCSAKAEAECNNLARKCGASLDACKTKRVSLCNAASGAAVSQGRSYKSGAVQDCLDKINDVYKDQAADATPTSEAEAATVCDRVFSGSKKERENCANTYECDGSLLCSSGVCVNQETVSLNGGCANAGQVCETGTYCQQGSAKFCVAKNKENDACGVDAPCLETLRCVNRCIPKVTVGQPCDTDDECAVEAPYCDQTTTPKKCRPKYESDTPACKDYGSAL
jgi:hypothetical protein